MTHSVFWKRGGFTSDCFCDLSIQRKLNFCFSILSLFGFIKAQDKSFNVSGIVFAINMRRVPIICIMTFWCLGVCLGFYLRVLWLDRCWNIVKLASPSQQTLVSATWHALKLRSFSIPMRVLDAKNWPDDLDNRIIGFRKNHPCKTCCQRFNQRWHTGCVAWWGWVAVGA